MSSMDPGEEGHTLMETCSETEHHDTGGGPYCRKKKVLQYTIVPKKPAGTPCVQPLVGGDWRLAAVGGW